MEDRLAEAAAGPGRSEAGPFADALLPPPADGAPSRPRADAPPRADARSHAPPLPADVLPRPDGPLPPRVDSRVSAPAGMPEPKQTNTKPVIIPLATDARCAPCTGAAQARHSDARDGPRARSGGRPPARDKRRRAVAAVWDSLMHASSIGMPPRTTSPAVPAISEPPTSPPALPTCVALPAGSDQVSLGMPPRTTSPAVPPISEPPTSPPALPTCVALPAGSDQVSLGRHCRRPPTMR